MRRRRRGWPTGADAVTLEIEQIGVDALERVAALAPLRPGVEPVRIIQDKTLQKPWLASTAFPWGRFAWCAAKRICMRRLRRWAGMCF